MAFDRVVKVVDFKPLAPHLCGFDRDFGFFLVRKISVVLLRRPFVPKTVHRRALEVFLHQ
jgi:hypothetical protein